MSYRTYLDQTIDSQVCRRDKYIELFGICVNAMVPVEIENPVDFYGDPNIINRVDRVMSIVPLYDQYHSLISIFGEDLENPIPLECLVKVSDHWPRESIFRLPVRYAGVLVDRYWKVINTEIKHTEVLYARKIICVPARDDEFEHIN